MTREEQMWKAVEQEHGELSRREAFITLSAMEWADKTMIGKACEFLKKYNTGVRGKEFIETFRKAMEEEV